MSRLDFGELREGIGYDNNRSWFYVSLLGYSNHGPDRCEVVSDCQSSCSAGAPFPRNFEEDVVKVIFKRLFRVYAHIYHSHFQKIVSLKEEAHLNTCFKHFIYFTQHFNLIDKKELAPLQELIDSIT